jgi:transposase-like protein
MVNTTLVCRHCGSPNLTKYGIAPNGKQKYFCRTCHRQSRDNPGTTAYSEEQREMILRAYQERSSLRGLERAFGVARSTVIDWLKEAQRLTALTQTLVPAIPSDPVASRLNWMNSGPLWARKQLSAGFGLLSAGKHAKLLRL